MDLFEKQLRNSSIDSRKNTRELRKEEYLRRSKDGNRENFMQPKTIQKTPSCCKSRANSREKAYTPSSHPGHYGRPSVACLPFQMCHVNPPAPRPPITPEMEEQYLNLLEKYDAQSSAVAELEEQLLELRAIAKEKSAENQQLVAALREKEKYAAEYDAKCALLMQQRDSEAALLKQDEEKKAANQKLISFLREQIHLGKETKRNPNYYKKLADFHLKQSSALAEQVLLLQNTYDRRNLGSVKFQSATNSYCEELEDHPAAKSARPTITPDRSGSSLF